MEKIPEYFNPNQTLREHFDTLSNPESFTSQSIERKRAIINFVIAYLLKYLKDALTLEDIAPFVQGIKRNLENPQSATALCKMIDSGRWPANQPTKADSVSVECLTDIRSTAALVEEIAFDKRFQQWKDTKGIGIELGAGSGILSIAALIGAARNSMTLRMTCVEQKSTAIDAFQHVLGQLGIGEDRCTIQSGDVSTNKPFLDFQQQCVNGGQPLRVWISETFNNMTPNPKINNGTQTITWQGRSLSFCEEKMVRTVDPFRDVVNHSVTAFPNFISRAQHDEIILFPDFVHGRIELNELDSTLTLASNAHVPCALSHAGRGYAHFEDFGGERFVSKKALIAKLKSEGVPVPKSPKFLEEQEAILRKKQLAKREKGKKNKKRK